MDRRKILFPILVATVCAGCHSGPAPEFPDWVGHFVAQPSRDGGENSFSQYARAADEAERQGGPFLNMVSFYPFQRRNAMKATAGALQLLMSAARSGRCEFEFAPTDPFKAPLHQRGWRLLGRDLVWNIDQAIQNNNYDAAVEYANVATRFGFDISGGGAIDASLGLAIVNETRQAIAPAMDHMGAAQLQKLAEGVTEALRNKPPLKQTIEHEHENMLEGVQTVQDAYRDERFEELGQELGPDSRSAIDYLQDLKRKDYSKRPKYFESFAGEGDKEVAWAEQVADIPVQQRLSIPEPKPTGERPWKKFSKEFFSSVRPLLEMNDQTLARTRLLILEASIMAQVKASGSAPKDLSGFEDDLKTDPYSGKPFIYGADGSDYHVYSVGADFRDDGGQTDETYTQPDLKLERG